MVVSVRLYAHIREVVGKEKLQLNLRRGATIQSLFGRLKVKHGRKVGEMLRGGNLVVMLNNKNIEFLDGLKTSLEDGDRISILPPLSGG